MNRPSIPSPKLDTDFRIPDTSEDALKNEIPRFSFKYYDHEHPDFSATKLTSNNIDSLFGRLREYCRLKWGEMDDEIFRFHPVEWHETKYKDGFKHLPDKIRKGITPRQFGIDRKFRIFGFFDGSIFCIVWFDKDHKVYGSK